MRALGLDIGAARIGVAVSDPSGRVASPVTVLDARSISADMTPLSRLVEDYEVECLVIGLPLTLAGEEGPQADDVRATAGRIGDALDVPIEFFDERLSSTEARRAMAAAGMSEREQRGALDKVAAAIVLQGWLDMKRVPAQEGR